jgi:hypothetical protein
MPMIVSLTYAAEDLKIVKVDWMAARKSSDHLRIKFHSLRAIDFNFDSFQVIPDQTRADFEYPISESDPAEMTGWCGRPST